MAKFHGAVGFVTQRETVPGVWEDEVVERTYFGDTLRASRRWEKTDHLNEDLSAALSVSIVADKFAYDNVSAIRYISWMGALWDVTSVELQRPRLILTVGGVYHGKTEA